MAALLVALVVPHLASPRLDAWLTVFLAIVLQATPFVVLGVMLAAGITEFVGESLLERLLPRRAALAVPAAGLAGIALPGCECASVPIAVSLIRNGAAPSAALPAGPARRHLGGPPRRSAATTTPQIRISTMRRIPAPKDPYEY